MASKPYTTPVGTNLRSIGSYFQIAGISIDNPSGSWLRITGVEQYVPPYTLGWSYPISPTILNLDVLFTDSPSGTKSELVGDPVTVTLYDNPVPQSAGFPAGALGRQPAAGVNLIQTLGFVANAYPAGSVLIENIPLPGYRINPTRFELAPGWNNNQVDGLRAPVLAVLETILGNQLVYLAISPESPTERVDIAPGAFDSQINNGQDLQVRVIPAQGAGRQAVTTTLHFHYVKVS